MLYTWSDRFDQTAHCRNSDFVLLPLSMFTLPNFVCGLNLEWSGKGIRWTCVEVCQGSEWEPCGTEVYWVCWPILSSVYYWCFSSSGKYVFHVTSACMFIFIKYFLFVFPARFIERLSDTVAYKSFSRGKLFIFRS